ncbi:hypothetical protein R3P38DRAFT_3186993 [Favolaschia claudopus]|uniref:DUF4283 domain-containing protein n=1 Tax=Favolaschia claudopus TaxID=2862362 RepID=A0AAW0C3W0_9AGAR
MSTSPSIQLDHRTKFSYYPFASFNTICFSLFYAMFAFECFDEFVQFVLVLCVHEMHILTGSASVVRCTIRLSHCVRPILQYNALGPRNASKLESALTSALSRASPFGLTLFRPRSFIRPGVLLLDVRLILNWNWYKPDTETMPVSVKAESVPLWLQLPVYFNINAGTMPALPQLHYGTLPPSLASSRFDILTRRPPRHPILIPARMRAPISAVPPHPRFTLRLEVLSKRRYVDLCPSPNFRAKRRARRNDAVGVVEVEGIGEGGGRGVARIDTSRLRVDLLRKRVGGDIDVDGGEEGGEGAVG